MKKLLSALLVLTMISTIFISCSKDDENTSPSNSISITGTFTVGDKTYTNPTFDLGDPSEHEGYIMPNYQKIPAPNQIKIQAAEDFDLGNNILLDYYCYINTNTPGEASASAYIEVYMNVAKEGLWIYCDNVTATVTKVGDVGGYIEGTYVGTFYPDKKIEVSYPVKGTFKVKRIEYITK